MSKSPETTTIPIAWVNRRDLIHCRGDLQEQLEALDEADVTYIAEKVGDGLQDCYWLVVESVLSEFFEAEK